jgi:hypothetical protein
MNFTVHEVTFLTEELHLRPHSWYWNLNKVLILKISTKNVTTLLESECPVFSVDYVPTVPTLVVVRSWGQDLFGWKCYISGMWNLCVQSNLCWRLALFSQFQQFCALSYSLFITLRFYIYTTVMTLYIVQSIISWIGRIVALLCTTTDTWSHEMVLCPFFSRRSKKQFRVCGVFRKRVTVSLCDCEWQK